LVVMAFIRHCCVDAAAVCRLGGSEDSSGRFPSRAREAAEYITARSRSPSNAVSIGEPHPDRSVDGRESRHLGPPRIFDVGMAAGTTDDWCPGRWLFSADHFDDGCALATRFDEEGRVRTRDADVEFFDEVRPVRWSLPSSRGWRCGRGCCVNAER
jgi:hypothetical protein